MKCVLVRWSVGAVGHDAECAMGEAEEEDA